VSVLEVLGMLMVLGLVLVLTPGWQRLVAMLLLHWQVQQVAETPMLQLVLLQAVVAPQCDTCTSEYPCSSLYYHTLEVAMLL
jgi:hypothetical protein